MKTNPEWQVYQLIAADKSLIAEVRIRGTRSETESTAHLIDAAPQMLTALKEAEIVLLKLCKSGSSKKALAAYDRVGAAIAKAEGK